MTQTNHPLVLRRIRIGFAPSMVRTLALGMGMMLWSGLYSTQADASRVALVIGNADYHTNLPLKNPANDARAMARKLSALNFTLIGSQAHVNVTRDEMSRLFEELRSKLDQTSGATALVYYSGHGVAGDGENWLLPVDDKNIEFREDVRNYAIGTNWIMNSLKRSGGGWNLLFFDACRNNTLRSRDRTKSAGSKKGLQRIDAPTGTIVVYATAPETVAFDGTGSLSPFTGALVEEMDRRGMSSRLEDVIGRVSEKVIKETGGNQKPWMDIQPLTYPFCFMSDSPYGSGGSTQIINDCPDCDWKDFAPRKECEECPLLVAVPAGEFEMGIGGIYKTERPIHSVKVDRFAVGIHEVTFSQWDACYESGWCSHRPVDNGWGRGDRPVIDVSWHDAQEYVGWLSRKTGKTYRLPSESEWEYVARAPRQSSSHTRTTISSDQANYRGDRYRGRTVDVGTLEANSFGLHDVHGNVWEWVEDCWHETYEGAPQDGKAWMRDGHCGMRVFRGGSWENPRDYVNSAYRWREMTTKRAHSIGFRVARTLNLSSTHRTVSAVACR